MASINLPFGGSIEIKDICRNTEYANGSRYRFKITDEYGWDISKSDYREMRLNSVLSEKVDNVLYHMYISRPGEMDTGNVFFNLGKSELSISGDKIKVKFKCSSLNQAEDLIDLILEPNGYKVAPVNMVNFEL